MEVTPAISSLPPTAGPRPVVNDRGGSPASSFHRALRDDDDAEGEGGEAPPSEAAVGAVDLQSDAAGVRKNHTDGQHRVDIVV